ncbi:hypothetical protein FHR32_003400 [Streptosporangium album]|uniref:Uncharacterized protein n=1 Tax=Streptosporangium album TaxID=47479 RepID=A0A7W7RVS6_9ACTN|nr:hypothetical protein [Streptosporangium album]
MGTGAPVHLRRRHAVHHGPRRVPAAEHRTGPRHRALRVRHRGVHRQRGDLRGLRTDPDLAGSHDDDRTVRQLARRPGPRPDHQSRGVPAAPAAGPCPHLGSGSGSRPVSEPRDRSGPGPGPVPGSGAAVLTRPRRPLPHAVRDRPRRPLPPRRIRPDPAPPHTGPRPIATRPNGRLRAGWGRTGSSAPWEEAAREQSTSPSPRRGRRSRSRSCTSTSTGTRRSGSGSCGRWRRRAGWRHSPPPGCSM